MRSFFNVILCSFLLIMLQYSNIGIFGKMNSGKSTLMNLLTQHETSIADTTPGTTADIKMSLMEIHGLGPTRLFDTAGVDEPDVLGKKKRVKTLQLIKECDLVLVVIDPSTSNFIYENEIIELAREFDKQIVIVFNLFKPYDDDEIAKCKEKLLAGILLPLFSLVAVDITFRQPLIDFILANFEPEFKYIPLLPFVEAGKYYVLIIPMDEETPDGRFLRPQALAMEYITRNWAFPVAYRLDLLKARSTESVSNTEKERFYRFINSFTNRPHAIITDSQAIDIMTQWVSDDILLTTFSVMMINYTSKGRLAEFYNGVKALETLKTGDKVLIAEACNHSRVNEDVGTVQIPAIISKRFPGVVVEHSFGRDFQSNNSLEKYKLIIHCGGCMISHQKIQARLRDLRQVGVPVTNYGIFLSWVQGIAALEKVVEPWLLQKGDY